jgi:hypothetical protein
LVSKPIIAECANWDVLLGALRGYAPGSFIARTPRQVAQGVLAAPAAIARWIVERSPGLARREVLELLIVGAERLDAVDQGRWYQFIALLVGADMEIRVTLVGDRLDAGFESPAVADAPGVAATCFRGSLAQFLASSVARPHDLVFVFHPGLQKHRAWLSDASIETVAAADAPVVVASYEQDESEIDRWVAECHGFTIIGDVLLNPLFLDFSADGSVARWGRALWRLGPISPGVGRKVDTDRLAALDDLARLVMQAVAQARTPSHAYGAEVEFRASDGASRRLYYVTDDYFLDPVDAHVVAFRDGQLLTAAHIPMRAVLAHPDMQKSDLERALWAAGIWSRYLAHLHPQAADEASRHALGRSMHAGLESQVEELFRGAAPFNN